MKKKLLYFLLLIFFSNAKAQIVSIRPDSADAGQTLTTTITMMNGMFTMASAPYQQTDIYLQQGANIIYQYAGYSVMTNVYILWDSLWTNFTIPSNASHGYYDLHVVTYDYMGTPTDWVLTNGFRVGHIAGTIEGDIYFDVNQNGVWDGGEPPLVNHKAMITPSNFIAYTDIAGHYKAFLDTGNYTVSYDPSPTFSQTSVPVNYSVPLPPSSTGNDFGAYSSANLYDNTFYVWHHPMRCQPAYGYTYFDLTNIGGLTVKGSITMVLSSNLSLHNAVPPPDVISGDTLTWYYTSLAPGQTIHYGGLNGANWISLNDPPAGQTIWYTVVDSIFDLAGNAIEQIPDSFGFVVTCSCDPNDKEVSPYGITSQHYIQPNTELNYTINFQNTGNDTAANITILDTLDANLDWNTFEVLSSTSPVHAQMDANGIVTFTFENINLPDSNVNEPGSHGAVAYRIQTDSLLPDPTQIFNTAYIYFDWNAPVVTNRTLNTVSALQPPVASFLTGDVSFCPGSCINFSNQSSSGTSYQWYFPGGNPSSSTSTDPTNICYPLSGNYDVELIATNALGSDTAIYPNYLQVYTVASQSIVQSGDTLFANQGFINYVWYYNGNIINGANMYYYVATQNGDYHVTAYDANGCDVEAVITNVMTSVSSVSGNPFTVYPNPTSDKIEIYGANGSVVSIFNVLGEKVFADQALVIKGTPLQIDMTSLTPGIYHLEITGGNKVYRAKVVKQ